MGENERLNPTQFFVFFLSLTQRDAGRKLRKCQKVIEPSSSSCALLWSFLLITTECQIVLEVLLLSPLNPSSSLLIQLLPPSPPPSSSLVCKFSLKSLVLSEYNTIVNLSYLRVFSSEQGVRRRRSQKEEGMGGENEA